MNPQGPPPPYPGYPPQGYPQQQPQQPQAQPQQGAYPQQQQPQGYPQQQPQGYPQQQPQGYPQQQPQQGGYPMMQPQQGGYPMMQGYGQPMGPKRNVALIVVSGISLFIGLIAFALFVRNAYQYGTVADDFADIPGSEWVVDIIKEGDMHRMMVFGPVSMVFGLGGLVAGFFGLRKR